MFGVNNDLRKITENTRFSFNLIRGLEFESNFKYTQC